MLQTIGVILVLLWLFGFIGHVGGSMIHLLLVAAAVVIVWSFLTRRQTV